MAIRTIYGVLNFVWDTLNPLNIEIGTIIAESLKCTISSYSDAISMKSDRKSKKVSLMSYTL